MCAVERPCLSSHPTALSAAIPSTCDSSPPPRRHCNLTGVLRSFAARRRSATAPQRRHGLATWRSAAYTYPSEDGDEVELSDVESWGSLEELQAPGVAPGARVHPPPRAAPKATADMREGGSSKVSGRKPEVARDDSWHQSPRLTLLRSAVPTTCAFAARGSGFRQGLTLGAAEHKPCCAVRFCRWCNGSGAPAQWQQRQRRRRRGCWRTAARCARSSTAYSTRRGWFTSRTP